MKRIKTNFLSKMNVDNPGELMEVLLANSEARKFLGDFIENTISKSHVSICLLALQNNYPSKLAITYLLLLSPQSAIPSKAVPVVSDNIFY